ncbi:MAG: response regulator [Desulfobulbaceae bacterium]|nr:response regulator [Desulfobulbaceae bacterium]
MNTISILVVEDNPGDLLLIKEYLSERQNFAYDLMECGTLESAIATLTRHDFDVVLLDLSLPDSFGLDTVRKVITNFPEIAVVVLTGLQDEDTAIQSVRYGAQDYLEKQLLSPGMLYKSIVYATERQKLLQEKEDLLHDLTLALQKIESLEGILPVCISCKKILDEKKQWRRIEEYIQQRSGAELVQLICPACKNDMEKESAFER